MLFLPRQFLIVFIIHKNMRKILFLKSYNYVGDMFWQKKKKKKLIYFKRAEGSKDSRNFDENSSTENAVVIKSKNIKLPKMFCIN